ncbi:putative peptide hydrolase PWA37_003774 [Arxiozyma heterogenica]|uniref:DUF159-domain-containing protein n=1 Tax=Arxiozyma heterogenica TaxID=278026 RepID=A0AAN8A6J2_9SACH|nr:hypothetical protein RI543_004934 [Kazachstania heterogenica]
MCGRYALVYDGDELARYMSNQLNQVVSPSKDSYERSYNVAPTKHMPVYFSFSAHLDKGDNPKESNQSADNINNKDKCHIGIMRWGFIPYWATDENQFKGYATINARLESLKTNKLYGQSLSTKRCVVPISGYYEWRNTNPKINKRNGKIPYYVTRRNSDELMYLAAVYDYNKTLDLYTFSIITGQAPKNLEWLHSRMPCVLEPKTKAWNIWLENSENIDLNQEELAKLLRPSFDEDYYICYEVSKDVGKVSNNRSYLVEPVHLSSNIVKKENKIDSYIANQKKDEKIVFPSSKEENDECNILKREEDVKDSTKLEDITSSIIVKEEEEEDKKDNSNMPFKRKRKLNVIELLHRGKKKKV